MWIIGFLVQLCKALYLHKVYKEPHKHVRQISSVSFHGDVTQQAVQQIDHLSASNSSGVNKKTQAVCSVVPKYWTAVCKVTNYFN